MFVNPVSDALQAYAVTLNAEHLRQALYMIEDEIKNPTFSPGKVRCGAHSNEIEAIFLRNEPLKLAIRDAVDSPFTAVVEGELRDNTYVRIVASDTNEEIEIVIAKLTYRTDSVLVFTPIVTG